MYQSKFRPSPERFNSEEALRIENGRDVLSFGVKFLDDVFRGINKNDLVVFSSKTGVGKTALASHIAFRNAAIGKRVHYFALEASHSEIEQRIKYKQLCDHYYANAHLYSQSMKGRRLDYPEWHLGRFVDVFHDVEEKINLELSEQLKTLNTLYSEEGYTLQNLVRDVTEIQNETDLIIIDHLHYFKTDPNQAEHVQYTEIVFKVMELSQQLRKPVILLVQLRRGDKKQKELVPDEDEIYGSSNIAKAATKIFTIARAYDEEPVQGMSLTYARVVKNRADGSSVRYVGKLEYSKTKAAYLDQYRLGTLSFDGSEWNEIPEPIPGEPSQYPHWFSGSQSRFSRRFK